MQLTVFAVEPKERAVTSRHARRTKEARSKFENTATHRTMQAQSASRFPEYRSSVTRIELDRKGGPWVYDNEQMAGPSSHRRASRRAHQSTPGTKLDGVTVFRPTGYRPAASLSFDDVQTRNNRQSTPRKCGPRRALDHARSAGNSDPGAGTAPSHRKPMHRSRTAVASNAIVASF